MISLLQQCAVGEEVEQDAQGRLHSLGFDMPTVLPGWPTSPGQHRISASPPIFQVFAYLALKTTHQFMLEPGKQIKKQILTLTKTRSNEP